MAGPSLLKAAAIFSIAFFGICAVGKPSFVPLNPNALGIPWTIAIGHVDQWGQGPVNAYGIDFLNNHLQWDIVLACMDSDGDGWPNGFELGDPCGVWKPGHHQCPPLWNYDISHPANWSSMPTKHRLNYTMYCGDKCVCRHKRVVDGVQRLLEEREEFLSRLPGRIQGIWRTALSSQLSVGGLPSPVAGECVQGFDDDTSDNDNPPCTWPHPPATGDSNSSREGTASSTHSLRGFAEDRMSRDREKREAGA